MDNPTDNQKVDQATENMKKLVMERLNTTGFVSELRVLQTLQARPGWFESGSPQYRDRDEDQMREYDAAAEFQTIRRQSGTEVQIAAETVLAIEVKKANNNPWIVMRRNSLQYSNDEREQTRSNSSITVEQKLSNLLDFHRA